MTILISRLIRRHSRLRFTRGVWAELIDELARRGRGERESGAFLLADADGERRRVVRCVYLDDLDPTCLNGAISFKGTAYGKLWALCRRERLTVVADVHTHPGGGVGQSATDRANPMIAKAGHIAVIVPDFAQSTFQAEDLGVHVYHGDHRWTSWFGRDVTKLVYIGWWA
jgi:proteasome lid subunit RPN8/RPN11